jgi:hypothetical protein
VAPGGGRSATVPARSGARPGVRVIVAAAVAPMLVPIARGQLCHDARDAFATVAAFLLLAGAPIVVRSATVVGVLGTFHPGVLMLASGARRATGIVTTAAAAQPSEDC